jgi:hypothetical protein
VKKPGKKLVEKFYDYDGTSDLRELNRELLMNLKVATAALQVLGAGASSIIKVIQRAEGSKWTG